MADLSPHPDRHDFNTWSRECVVALRTLRQQGPVYPDGSPIPHEVIVVDNLSPNKSPELIAAVEQELKLIAERRGIRSRGG